MKIIFLSEVIGPMVSPKNQRDEGLLSYHFNFSVSVWLLAHNELLRVCCSLFALQTRKRRRRKKEILQKLNIKNEPST